MYLFSKQTPWVKRSNNSERFEGIKVAMWNFQLLPLSIFLHSPHRKRCPLGILKYFVMPEQCLKLFKILEIKIQEAWAGNPIINISVLFSYA